MPVTQSDLQFVADRRPDSPSGYHGVYVEKGLYVPKAFRRRVGPPQETARQAAVLLVEWWQSRYGGRWREVWYYRQTTGWTELRCRRGVWAVAEVCGRAAVTVGVGPDGRACDAATVPGCRPFTDRASAAKGVREWAAREWGADGNLVVRRTWAAESNRARLTPVPPSASL